MASLLSIRDIAKSFGKNPVLRNISLEIAEGEFLTILWRAVRERTTLLRIIAGFENADSGEISMAGERFDDLPPYRRRVNTVFQSYALFLISRSNRTSLTDCACPEGCATQKLFRGLSRRSPKSR